MILPASPIFPASVFGDALGCSPQAIRQRLDGQPGQTLLADGNEVQAWPVSALPAAMQSELEATAAARGFRNALALLTQPAPAWQPKKPLSEIAPAYVDKAIKLRAALAPALARLDDPRPNRAASEAAALAEFQKELGYTITARHWRRLFQRTLDRDAGARAWHRVELYLDDNAGRPKPPGRASLLTREIHQPLQDTVAALENKAQLTTEDRAFLWHQAFTHFEKMEADHPEKRERRLLKTSLLDYLFAAVPALSKTPKALRTSFETKLRAWQEGGKTVESVRDQRSIASGNFRKPDFTEDQNKIRNLAILHNGSESLAHRLLRQRGELSPEFVNYYDFDPRKNKSRVPAAVRQAITPEVDMCGPIHRGPWQARMAGPCIPRDWSGVQPADWFSADDITFNSYFYFYDDAGQLHIERGECLVLIDLRTGYVLDYILIAGKYNARHIRKLILRAHDTHGLPHQGFYFEQGVWKARMIEELDSKHSLHWRETETGLKERGIGLDVRHATTPRAKTIEGLIRIWQERQRTEPGFVGFNERTQDMERMQDQLARARRGTLKPETFLLTMDQWAQRLDNCFQEFNADPQNGKMLPGLSPGEAWRNGLTALRKLPDNARYLLASHKKQVKVHQHGIVLTIGGERLVYYNEQTAALIGRDVLIFYNIELPDLLTVSDLNRQNYFTVKRILLPAMSATKEQFAEAHAQIAGHRKAAKVIYGNIKHRVISTVVNDNEQDRATMELGEFHNRATAEHETEQSAATRKLRKVQRTAAADGVALPSNIRNPDRVQKGLDCERKVRERLALRAQPGDLIETGAKKTYILDNPQDTGGVPSVGKYWALWNKVEKLPGRPDRHALTQKHLGCHPKPQDMTPGELQKMIDVALAILRDAKQPANLTP